MFHWYGFIVGVAVVSVLWLLEYIAAKSHSEEKVPLSSWQITQILICMLVAARMWHLMTDWSLYVSQPWQIFAVWNGGLSILGAVIGLLAGIWISVKSSKERWWLLDAVALCLPIGQAIGRLANYVNQELYGLPTNLPWKLYIDPSHRLPGFETVAYYQPLFMYEIIALLLLAGILWRIYWQQPKKMGQGRFFGWYVLLYGTIRLGLDFLRLDRPEFFYGLGFNQLFLISVIGFSASFLFRWWGTEVKKKQSLLLFLAVVVTLFGLSLIVGKKLNRQLGGQAVESQQSARGVVTSSVGLSLTDRQKITVLHQEKRHIFEVVNTNASRTLGLSNREEIGADGMLFVFPSKNHWVFWMKDMHFDLDLIWLLDGKVMDISTQVAAPSKGTSLAQLKQYLPKTQVNMVLEVPAGKAQELHFQIGDVLLME